MAQLIRATKPVRAADGADRRARMARHQRLMRQRIAALFAGDTARADALRIAMADIDIQERP